jgi:DNA ligase-4
VSGGESAKLKRVDPTSCILDGEMLVYDPLLERYLAFGTLKTAALGKPIPHAAADPSF